MLSHQAVLYEEVLEQINIKPSGIYLDCTFGRGGHSQGILAKLNPSGRLIAVDRDLEAIQSDIAQKLTADHRFSLFHSCFCGLTELAKQENILGEVDGVLMDLGVSSPQLDSPERGFSFLRDGPLDMRMDKSQGISAADYLAHVQEKELASVIFEFGEERFARRIAQVIVEQRSRKAIETTLQLANLIEHAVPFRDKFKHPATRTFQAIRIVINEELEQIKVGLHQATNILAPGGRLVVIAFHSLEDRIIKRFIRAESGHKINPGRLPIKELDIEKGQLKKIGKAIRASEQELRLNPRARSAVLRVAEKLK